MHTAIDAAHRERAYPRRTFAVNTIQQRMAVILTVAACTTAGALSREAAAWDSRKRNPTHPTHSYITEWAIDQVGREFPEVQTYRNVLVDGANQEPHELPISGRLYGVDLEAKRREHRGTNEGSDDVQGWWNDALAAYRAGNKQQAYFLLGILLHMVEDMGVPAHANRVIHQGNLTEFDNFEFLAVSNWKPNFNSANHNDPRYPEPWRYYRLSEQWTLEDAPNYHDRSAFSKTWAFASPAERDLLRNRQGRTCFVTSWALRSGAAAFSGSQSSTPPGRSSFDPNAFYRITNGWQRGKSIDVINDNRENRWPTLSPTASYDGQYWRIQQQADGAYRITNKWQNGKSLDVLNEGGGSRRPVLSPSANYLGQSWQIIPASNGYYRITNKWQTGKSLDVINRGNDSRELTLAPTSDVTGQFWRIAP